MGAEPEAEALACGSAVRAHERLAAHDAHEAPWAHLVTLAPRLEVGEAHAHSNAPIGGEEGAAQLLIAVRRLALSVPPMKWFEVVLAIRALRSPECPRCSRSTHALYSERRWSMTMVLSDLT